MLNAVRADEAENAVRSALYRLLDADVIDRVSVAANKDPSDEPALFVLVHLKQRRDRPTADKRIEIIGAMIDSLLDLDDARFPFLYFAAPDDTMAEETRD